MCEFVDNFGDPVIVGDVYLGRDNRWYEIAEINPASRYWPIVAMPEGFDPEEADGFPPGHFGFRRAGE